MKFNELLEKIGVTSYPAGLDGIYEALTEDDGSLYDLDYLKEMQDKYELFGEYYDEVTKGAVDIKNRPELIAYGRAVVEFNKNATSYESRLIKLPKNDATPATDILPVLILAREVPDMIKRYEARGFNEAQILKNLECIKINLWVLVLRQGRPYLDQGHYNWICHYTKAMIFDHKAFNFQPAVWGSAAIYLRNKESGECLPMMTQGRFAKNGLPLGAVGATDEDGAFDAEFTEIPQLFIGHLVRDGRVEEKLSKLSRTEWECVLRPGDDVISLHIPENTNLSPDFVMESIREGFELSKKYYPELNPKFVVCYSWLLEPKLVELCGEKSRIAFFTTRFTKYPMKDTTGTGCLGYVFPGYQSGPVENFPENTTLQRGIKKLMLDGDFIRGTAGVIVEL